MIYFITHQYRSWFGGCLLWVNSMLKNSPWKWADQLEGILRFLTTPFTMCQYANHGAGICTPTFASHVGKYISTMEHLGYVMNMWSWKKSTLLMYASTASITAKHRMSGSKNLCDHRGCVQTSIYSYFDAKIPNWLIEEFVPFNCARTDSIFAELVWRFPKIGVSPVIIHWAAWDCPWNQPSIWGYHHDFVNHHDCEKTSLIPFAALIRVMTDSGWCSP